MYKHPQPYVKIPSYNNDTNQHRITETSGQPVRRPFFLTYTSTSFPSVLPSVRLFDLGNGHRDESWTRVHTGRLRPREVVPKCVLGPV